MDRILVTGGGGFVGGHAIAALRAAFPAAEVVATHLAVPPGSIRPGFAPLDITDADAVETLVAGLRPDACLHLAGIAAPGVARRDPDLAWRVNLHGTLAIARALIAHAPEAVLLAAGSAEVYGAAFRAGHPLAEDAALAPLTTYGATKAAADLALGALAAESGLRVIRARPFNHTGPGQAPDFALPAFARQIARIEAGRQPPVIATGDLSPARDFLDVRDVCVAYVAMLRDPPPPGTALNVASGTPRRIGDALAGLVARAGVAVRVEADAALLRPSDIPTAAGDASRLRALGWSPAIPWETTLDDLLADWRARVAKSSEA